MTPTLWYGPPLRETWRDPTYSVLRDRVRRFDFPLCSFCGGCEHVERNETDCLGNPLLVCGDCLWAREIIQCV